MSSCKHKLIPLLILLAVPCGAALVSTGSAYAAAPPVVQTVSAHSASWWNPFTWAEEAVKWIRSHAPGMKKGVQDWFRKSPKEMLRSVKGVGKKAYGYVTRCLNGAWADVKKRGSFGNHVGMCVKKAKNQK